VVNTRQSPWYRGMVEGLTVMPLSEFGTHHTALVRWAPGTYFNPHRHFGGEEIYVVEGVFSDEHGRYTPIRTLSMPAVKVFDLIRT
jgi:anti-sigma factor ChrR (cupin superfamily)